jgi:Caspase domain
MLGPGRRLALLIGSGSYKSKSLPWLSAPEHDVHAIKDILQSQGDYVCDLLTNEDVKYAITREKIVGFVKELQPEDTGFLYYSERWLGLFEQFPGLSKWSLCRG